MLFTHTFKNEAGESYTDRKRSAWFLSLFIPATVLMGPLLYQLTGHALSLWSPLIFYYFMIPLADWVLGGDRSNPPETLVPQLEEDPYYRYVTYALAPILWGAFLYGAWFVGTQNLPWHGVLAMGLVTGQICGFGLNLGHELGHKKSTVEKTLGRIVLALGAYGHFSIEHNKGHHRDVATPEDSASSRMGENLYSFMLREMPGGLIRAWRLEEQRLAKKQHSAWHWENEILQTGLLSLALYAILFASFGWIMLPFLAVTCFWGAFQLTCANFVEHYGLLRQRDENGKYERCQPQHSWNSNHIFSNWALFHLQRHSDHHANPARRYQSLRHFEDVPQLPSGYTGTYILAWFPPIWRRVMDPKLLRWAEYDATRINMDPKKAEKLIARHQLKTAA